MAVVDQARPVARQWYAQRLADIADQVADLVLEVAADDGPEEAGAALGRLHSDVCRAMVRVHRACGGSV